MRKRADITADRITRSDTVTAGKYLQECHVSSVSLAKIGRAIHLAGAALHSMRQNVLYRAILFIY